MPALRKPEPAAAQPATFRTRDDVYLNPYDLDDRGVHGLFRYLSHVVGRAASSDDARGELAKIDVDRLHPATLAMLKCLLGDAWLARSALDARSLRVIDAARPLARPITVDANPMHYEPYARMGVII